MVSICLYFPSWSRNPLLWILPYQCSCMNLRHLARRQHGSLQREAASTKQRHSDLGSDQACKLKRRSADRLLSSRDRLDWKSSQPRHRRVIAFDMLDRRRLTNCGSTLGLQQKACLLIYVTLMRESSFLTHLFIYSLSHETSRRR